jgi:hypothetical protein
MKTYGPPNKFFTGIMYAILFSIPIWVVIYLSYLKLRGRG